MSKYDDPRYEKLEDNVYFDHDTRETIFVFHDELAETMIEVFGVDELDADQTKKLLGPYLDKLLDEYESKDLFSDDSDLKEL
jgi:hypothetical protein